MDEQNGSGIPPAQGEQPAAQVPEQQTSNPVRMEGVEKRIAELVAGQHEWQRRFEEERSQREQVQQMLATVVQQQQAQFQRQQPDPYAGVEIEPEERQKVEAVVNPYLRQMAEQQKQMEALIARQRARSYAERVVNDPKVADLAERFVAEWSQKGYTGWAPEDATRYALGVLTEQERQKNAGQRQVTQNQQTVPPPLLTQNAPPPIADYRSRRPANFEQLSADKQMAILEQEVGDLPL